MLDFSKKVITVEVTPPSRPDLRDFLADLEKLRDYDGINVTELAMRNPDDRWVSTLYTAVRMREAGFNPIPHITCRDHSRRDAISIALALMDAGVDNMLVIRGDEGLSKGIHELSVPEMISLIKDLYEENGREAQILAAANPYSDPDLEANSVAKKVRSGAVAVQTQPIFDPSLLRDFVALLKERGIEMKVLAGVLPVVNRGSLMKLESRLGIRLSESVRVRIGRIEGEQDLLSYIEDLSAELLSLADGIHLYPMGNLDLARRLAEVLRRL